MDIEADAYPLCWPEGWPRTPAYERERSSFRTSPDKARKYLLGEIQRLVGRHQYDRDDVILSTNIKLRIDGEPYSNQKKIEDPGVAVYFRYRDRNMVFACDRWDLIHDNMHSIALTIDALRGIERWGASDMLERAFTGFEALPFQPDVEPWNQVLQCGRVDMTTFEECQRNYRDLAKVYHPDRGGTNEQMARLNWAFGEAKKHFGVTS